MDASGFSVYYEERRKIAEEKDLDVVSYFFDDDREGDKEYWRPLSEAYHRMEKDFYDDDTDMLMRLVKGRRDLWT